MIPTMRKTNKQRTLQEVYEETNNTSCFVSVEDTEVQNLLLKHIRKGYTIISETDIKGLVEDIQKVGFLYTLLTSDKNKWLLILYPKKTNGKLSLQEMKGFIAPKPQCYSERHIRSLKGEIFLLK